MSYPDPKKILIVNLGGIGDLLLSTPALKALKNYYPEAEISILVVPRVYAMVKNWLYLDAVFVFHLGYLPSGMLKNIFTLLTLRDKHFDLLINMRTIVSFASAVKLSLLLNFIGAKIKAGRNTDGKGKMFDIAIPETLIGQKYEAEYDLETVRALGIKSVDMKIDFEIDAEESQRIDAILEEEGIAKEAILIGVNPGGLSSRRWPVEKFSSVIDKLAQKMACNFLVTGSREEHSLAQKLKAKSCARIVDLAGKLSIQETAALIKRCNLYISNDTGPMHIAAILKTPLIVIFGPGDLARYDPRNISDKTIVLGGRRTICAPCNKKTCMSMRCFEGSIPQEAVDVAMVLLKKE